MKEIQQAMFHRNSRVWYGLPALLIIVVVAVAVWRSRPSAPSPAPPEPLVPTVASEQRRTPTPWPAVTITPVPRPPEVRRRLCAGVARGRLEDYPYTLLQMGWYLDWRVRPDPPHTPGLTYARMVRMKAGRLREPPEYLTDIARRYPGSLWLIGNEPDVRWQDNTPPDAYARAYHTAYRAIKQGDPTARVAIGAVSQVTPLRLAYLDRVLAAYRAAYGKPLPVDAWNVHVFILREEAHSWGVGIPPGMEGTTQGVLWEIQDHDRIDLLQRQVLEIRRWLYNRGYRGIPLIVSEYGILMPPEYGFPPERVIRFLRRSFDLFFTLRDPLMGDPRDGYRLVQQWCWYSMADTLYATGNLFDPVRKTLTPIGAAFATYRPPVGAVGPPAR